MRARIHHPGDDIDDCAEVTRQRRMEDVPLSLVRPLRCLGTAKKQAPGESPAGKTPSCVEALRGRVTPHHRTMLRLHLQIVDALAGGPRRARDRSGKSLGADPAAARLLTTMPGISDIVATSWWRRSAST